MPLAAGTRLGPYEILAPIGAGGMGEVYHARDTRLGRDVAIKVSVQQFTGPPPLDLAPDGKRFAILPRSDPTEAQGGSVHVTFLLNFFDELRRRVPAR
jgi:serine/threonine protein kinase